MFAEFSHLTRDRLGEVAGNSLAVLVVGATEQHGPHLDVSVDAVLGGAVARSAALLASNEIDVVLCPTVPFGASHHHLDFPGNLSLSTATLTSVLMDLGESLISCGFRSLFFLGSHGGNDDSIRSCARNLVHEHDVSVGAASYWTLAWRSLVDDGAAFSLGRVPGHAGGFETSLMMAIAPNGVHLDRFPPTRSLGSDRKINEDPAAAPVTARHGSWRAIDGYSDDARDADAEAGRRVFDLIVRDVAKAWVEFHRPGGR